MYDVAVIGAGVAGCAIARELCRLRVSVAVIDRNFDVGGGASRANSAIVHAGYDAEPGTLMAELNVKGNAMYDGLCAELGVPLKRIGSLLLAFNDEDMRRASKLYKQGIKNGVPGVELLNAERAREMEPAVAEGLAGALYAPSGGITCPFTLTFALAENAAENGAEFLLGSGVEGLEHDGSCWNITLGNGKAIKAHAVVNAAGAYADVVSEWAGAERFSITVRRGEYYLLDRTEGTAVNHVIFQPPTALGKGVLISPTVDGNLIVGPSAQDQRDRDDVSTTAEGLASVAQAARLSVPSVRLGKVITSFTGLRAVPDPYDFQIYVSELAKNFVQAGGICSPGLTSAPAIGERVAELVQSLLNAEPNPAFNPVRNVPKPFREMDWAEREQAIAEDERYAHMICRCETVTEAEIVRAVHSKIPALTLDALKRRVRTGAGRCQGGFCSPRVMEIIARETGIDELALTKFGGGSYLISERLKGRERS